MNVEEHLAKARLIVKRDAPYMSGLLYGLIPVPVPGLGTMGVTESLVLIYDPDWIVTIPIDELAGVVFHELNHIVRFHFNRFRNVAVAERDIANDAADLAINPGIIKAGWKLPSFAKLPAMFDLPDGLTAEQYFEKLRKNKKSDGSSKRGVCAGCCGSIAGNPSGTAEPKIDKELGREQDEINQIVSSAKEAIRKATQAARGKMPLELLELMKKPTELPLVDWRSELNRQIRRVTGRFKSGGKDFSIRRPSKRSFSRGLLRPGLVQQQPEILVIRDSSASMAVPQLKTATSETIGIIKASGVDSIWFMDADSGVALTKRVRVADFETLGVHGRGGTNFIPAIEAAVKLKPKPDIIIYITDGDGLAPKHQPAGVEFIWCVVPSPYKRKPANWGHLIIISDTAVTLNAPYEVTDDS